MSKGDILLLFLDFSHTSFVAISGAANHSLGGYQTNFCATGPDHWKMIAASPKQIAGCSNLSYLQSGCLTGVNTARNRQEPHFSTKSNSEINYELNTSLSISSQPAVPCRTALQHLGLTRTTDVLDAVTFVNKTI